MVDISNNQNKVLKINVSSTNNANPCNIINNSTIIYSDIAKDWAIKTDGTVDGTEFSSKHYALQSKNAKEQLLNNSDFLIVANDLNNENTIGICAENISDIQNANNNAQTAIQQAQIATNKAAEAAATVDNSITDIANAVSEQIELIQSEAETQISNIQQIGFYMCEGKLFYIDENGEEQEFEAGGGTSLPLFTPVIQDYVLSFKESKGYALQGTYVYKTGISGSRYGYPDFVQKCIDEKEAGTATEITLGDNTITMYVNTNGHQFYDIADKTAVDEWFNTYGIADFYGVDEENERIFLPRNNWFMQLTTDVSKVNQYNEAGLPNIKGNLCGGLGSSGSYTQAFKYTSTVSNRGAGDFATCATVSFDASRSSNIYGNSNTVQPPSSNKLLYYVVGNTTEVTHVTTSIPSEDIISQVNKNTTDITAKVDMAQAANASMPSNRYIDLTLGASGSIYTAPADGWFAVSKVVGSTYYYITMGILDENGETLYNDFRGEYSTSTGTPCMPVKKGDKVKVTYNATGTTRYFRFIYANGVKSEEE